MPRVQLITGFPACKLDRVRVNDNHIISTVIVLGESGFVLAANNVCDLCGESSHDLALGVDEVP